MKNKKMPSIKKFVSRRWRIFSESTTLHGVKEIARAPVGILKVLWLFLVTLSACMMFYQIYKLADHYLTEPITTTVSAKQEPYPTPLFMFVAHSRDLFPPCAASGSDPQRICPFPDGATVAGDDRLLDYETLTYGRSLVDSKVITDRTFNYRRAKEKFERFFNSTNGSALTYDDLLKPYMTDISNWFETGGVNPQKSFRVVQRSLWSIATYFMVEPAAGNMIKQLHHDFQIEAHFNWHNMSVFRRPGSWAAFVITSYGLLTDAVRFEPGRILKIRFEIQSHKRAPLRRKACQTDAVRVKMYDEQRCNESCFLKAEQKWMPRTCYVHKNYDWGFYDMYKRTRPCSFGFVSWIKDGVLSAPFGFERSEYLPGGRPERMEQEYRRCLAEECLQACELLEVKLESSSREFATELGNRSLLYATWPALNAVTVYEVGLQYTWDGFVGQLGGLVGLWMGASMMSVCEALYLCCCCCYDVRKEKMASPRRSPSNTTGSIYKKSRDEEMRYGGVYHKNGTFYQSNGDELRRLQPTTWTLDETEKRL